MKVLLKQVNIVDLLSPYHGLIKDILIVDGYITEIEDAITADDARVVQVADLHASQGWVDTFAHFNDPGFEQKETLESGAEAAAAGGFTHVFILPNTQPAITNKTAVEYVVQKSARLPISIHPYGSVTKNIEGKELAEMYDMHTTGAIAFSDGLHPVQSPGLLLKALQYIKAIDGVIVQLPLDASIAKFGLMNEGVTSTRLGLQGTPTLAEELIVSRDIELLKYTGSSLHITGITTQKSVALIKDAKQQGLKISCSVTPQHLLFCDEDLSGYDTNLKSDPPLRNRTDMLALREAVLDGTIDCIASHHLPQIRDNKVCEFEYAAPGMIALETVFPVLNQLFPQIDAAKLVALLSDNARRLFKLDKSSITKGAIADITLFSRTKQVTYLAGNIKSKSKNSPFIGQSFTGGVVGIFAKDKIYLNA